MRRIVHRRGIGESEFFVEVGSTGVRSRVSGADERKWQTGTGTASSGSDRDSDRDQRSVSTANSEQRSVVSGQRIEPSCLENLSLKTAADYCSLSRPQSLSLNVVRDTLLEKGAAKKGCTWSVPGFKNSKAFLGESSPKPQVPSLRPYELRRQTNSARAASSPSGPSIVRAPATIRSSTSCSRRRADSSP